MSEKREKDLVLIVDDVVKNIQVLGVILRDNNYDLVVAQDGEQALAVGMKTMPDLILLDVMMPVMDGFEACKRFKEDEKTRDIPIIFLTAKDDPDDIAKGFNLGAIDYVTKPFNSTELLSRVKTHLTLYKLQQHLEHLVEERTAQLSDAHKKLQHQVRELNARDQMVQLQMSGLELERVHQTIVELTKDVVIAKKVALYCVDETEHQLNVKAACGLLEEDVFLSASELTDQTALPLDDTQSAIVKTFHDHKPNQEDGVMVPILFDEKALGVLWIDSLDHAELSEEEELEALWRLGQEAALVLDAAQMSVDLEAGDLEIDSLFNLDE